MAKSTKVPHTRRSSGKATSASQNAGRPKTAAGGTKASAGKGVPSRSAAPRIVAHRAAA